MDGTETDVRRTGGHRRRRLTVGALLALMATLATTLMVANPASAAAVCGNRVTARVSLHYKACNAPGPNPGTMRVTFLYINDHGSDVNNVWTQFAYKINGHLTGGDWIEEYWKWYDDHREQRAPDALWDCPRGTYLSFAMRIKENDDTAGPWSVAPAILCP